jgi:hypothetical protein
VNTYLSNRCTPVRVLNKRRKKARKKESQEERKPGSQEARKEGSRFT